jgi:ornithine cyclodeaminase/alanine dehydrogenase-like protein (mu-crystallin family)
MGLPAPSVLLVRAVASRGHESDEDVTAFDATALAIQDLAISVEVVERYVDRPNADRFSGVDKVEIG